MDELLVNSRPRVARDQVLHVRRQSPLSSSRVTVSLNQEVEPGDVVWEGKTSSGFRMFKIAQVLGVEAKLVPQYLSRQVGQTIYQGELLAAKPGILGFGKQEILSPVDGLIDFFDPVSGNLKIRLTPKNFKITSGVYGIVESINQPPGVVLIKTLATVIYGLVGSGQQRHGLIRLLDGPGELIGSKQLSQAGRGQIVVGGGLVLSQSLYKAVALGLAGIVSGGINAKDYRALTSGDWNIGLKNWSDVGFSIIITEGFGAAPIGADIYPSLKLQDGKVGIIDGNLAQLILPSYRKDAIMYIRKTKLPIGVIAARPDSSLVKLGVGCWVRLIDPVNLGMVGKVVGLDLSLTLLEGGIKTILVTVQSQTRKIKVPYQNLESII